MAKDGNRIGADRDFSRDAQFMNQASKSPLGGTRTTARAFFVSDRLNTSGLERGDVLATTPLAFRVNESGVAILFRYGVVILIGLNALEEEGRGMNARLPASSTRPSHSRGNWRGAGACAAAVVRS